MPERSMAEGAANGKAREAPLSPHEISELWPRSPDELDMYGEFFIRYGPDVASWEMDLRPDHILREWRSVLQAHRVEVQAQIDLSNRLADAAFSKFDADAAVDHRDGLLSMDDLEAMPHPEFAVEGFVPATGVCGVYGPPGVGKTLLLISLAQAVQRGGGWLSTDSDVRQARQGLVLFYLGETALGVGGRVRAFRAKYGDEDTDARARIKWSEQPVNLADPRSVAAVIRTVWNVEREHGEPVRMVVLDPLTTFFSGEENGEGMVLAARGAVAIANVCQAAVVVGHHTNAEGSRGRGNDAMKQLSVGWYRMEADGPDRAHLLAEKFRHGPEMALSLLRVPVGLGNDSEGRPLSSATFVPTGQTTVAEFMEERAVRKDAKKQKQDAEKGDKAEELILAAVKNAPGISQKKLLEAVRGNGIGNDKILATRDELAAESGPLVMVQANGNRHYLRGQEPS